MHGSYQNKTKTCLLAICTMSVEALYHQMAAMSVVGKVMRKYSMDLTKWPTLLAFFFTQLESDCSLMLGKSSNV